MDELGTSGFDFELVPFSKGAMTQTTERELTKGDGLTEEVKLDTRVDEIDSSHVTLLDELIKPERSKRDVVVEQVLHFLGFEGETFGEVLQAVGIKLESLGVDGGARYEVMSSKLKLDEIYNLDVHNRYGTFYSTTEKELSFSLLNILLLVGHVSKLLHEVERTSISFLFDLMYGMEFEKHLVPVFETINRLENPTVLNVKSTLNITEMIRQHIAAYKEDSKIMETDYSARGLPTLVYDVLRVFYFDVHEYYNDYVFLPSIDFVGGKRVCSVIDFVTNEKVAVAEGVVDENDGPEDVTTRVTVFSSRFIGAYRTFLAFHDILGVRTYVSFDEEFHTNEYNEAEGRRLSIASEKMIWTFICSIQDTVSKECVFTHIETIDHVPIPIGVITHFLTTFASASFPVGAHCAAGFGRTGTMILMALGMVLGINDVNELLEVLKVEYSRFSYNEIVGNFEDKEAYSAMRPAYTRFVSDLPTELTSLMVTKFRRKMLKRTTLALVKKYNRLYKVIEEVQSKASSLVALCEHYTTLGIGTFVLSAEIVRRHELSIMLDDDEGSRDGQNGSQTRHHGQVKHKGGVLNFGPTPSFLNKSLFTDFDMILSLQETYTEYGLPDYRFKIATAAEKSICFMNFPIEDHRTLVDGDLIRVVAFLIVALELKLKIYMHCLSGHGRTGSVLVNLCTALYGNSTQDVLQFLRKAHLLVHPNNEDCCFLKSQLETEDQLNQAYRLQPMFLMFHHIRKNKSGVSVKRKMRSTAGVEASSKKLAAISTSSLFF